MRNNDDRPERKAKTGLFQVVKAVLAAAIGVQNRADFERDMQARSPLPYILVGIVATAAFILTVVMIVRLVLRHATG